MTTRILIGDCRDLLPTLPDQSVHCCVTSPPYFGLRDYGVDGQMGLESSAAEFIAGMVDVFREVRRVLRDDGTLWLNIGDSYAGYHGNKNVGDGPSPSDKNGYAENMRRSTVGLEFKQKDLMMIPARLAIALQDDGWYLRSDIIWAKPNPMPESVTDRPTSAHEHIFLLTKSARYWYDAEAVRTALLPSSLDRLSQDVDSQEGSVRANGGAKTNGAMKAVARFDKQRGHSRRHDGFNDRWDAMPRDEQLAGGANLRNVWMIATQPYPGSHFATFPTELPRRCIKAGCPVGGVVLDPFAGSGTVGMVADQLGRDSILIELNPEYGAMANARITNDAPMFAEVLTA